MGMHGEDSDAFKDLISSSGIIDKCDFTDHLNLSELHAYMSLPNIVVFDQFAVRNYSILGGVEREAISIGAKVVSEQIPRNLSRPLALTVPCMSRFHRKKYLWSVMKF